MVYLLTFKNRNNPKHYSCITIPNIKKLNKSGKKSEKWQRKFQWFKIQNSNDTLCDQKYFMHQKLYTLRLLGWVIMVVLTLEAKRDLKLLGKFNSWLKLNLNKKICNGLSKEHDIRIEETFFLLCTSSWIRTTFDV